MWVYIRSEPNLYTVGFYDPEGNWHPDSDHENKQKAANRTAFLNGSPDIALCQQRDRLAEACRYFVDGWRVVPTDKIDMAYSLGDAALASIKEQ